MMEVPENLAEEFGVAIQLGRLWRQYPGARLQVESVAGGAYKASVTVPSGPTVEAHSAIGLHALSRTLTHLGLVSDLTDYP